MLCRCWGVKTVSEIYVGVGGTAYKVWPSYTDYGGDTVTLDSDTEICQEARAYVTRYSQNSGYGRRGNIWGYTNGYNGYSGSGMYGTNRSFEDDNNSHWWSIGPMDTRGYNYIQADICAGNFSYTISNYRLYFLLGYNSVASNSPMYGGHYVHSDLYYMGSANSSGGYDTDYSTILFDISNINLESTYIQIGAQVTHGTEDARYHAIHSTKRYMYKTKPSGSFDLTVTF